VTTNIGIADEATVNHILLPRCSDVDHENSEESELEQTSTTNNSNGEQYVELKGNIN